MNDRIGTGISIVGALLLIVGVVALFTQSDDDGQSVGGTSTVASSTTASANPVPSTTAAPTTVPSTTAVPTTVAPTTAAPTTAPSTTAVSTSAVSSSVPPTTAQPQTVEQYFALHVAAIEADDVDFLFDTLHPLVLEQPTADLCRTFIEREILALGDYRVTGDIVGPTPSQVAGALVADLYTVPVRFEFQGQTFDGAATFAPVDGEMRWFTQCR